jgi:hypothetical protein
MLTQSGTDAEEHAVELFKQRAADRGFGGGALLSHTGTWLFGKSCLDQCGGQEIEYNRFPCGMSSGLPNCLCSGINSVQNSGNAWRGVHLPGSAAELATVSARCVAPIKTFKHSAHAHVELNKAKVSSTDTRGLEELATYDKKRVLSWMVSPISHGMSLTCLNYVKAERTG